MTREEGVGLDTAGGGDWREDPFFRRPPSRQTLIWVATAVGANARIAGHRRLTGGVNSAVHLLTVERGGTRIGVVLRQYPPGNQALRAALESEIAALAVVAGSGLPVPTVISADVDGVATGGAPSLLMTQLPGQLELSPGERGPWIEEIARFAARLHAVDLPAPTFRPWSDSWITPLEQLRTPAGARRPALWQVAFDAMTWAPPEDRAAFLHGDFLPVNLLWSCGTITGITDWNGIHRGSPAVDVGQARRYLAALYSPAWSEELRSRYEAITGFPLQPWWDLYALLHHSDDAPTSITRQVAGRLSVDVVGMTARVEVLVEEVLRRLG